MATLADLYDEYGPRLFRYAVLLLADTGAAEDVIQEAFCALARTERRDASLVTLAYLRTIVRNECYSAIRRRRRSREVQGGELLEPAAGGTSEDERLMLEGALRTLPPDQREVVYLKVYEGMTFDEIGEHCGISLNTAASRYRYALDALRRALAVTRSGT